jgi:hypothetical protein
MVIDDLDLVGIGVAPLETNAPLDVDPNAPLVRTVASKTLQTIARRHSQVPEILGVVEHSEFSSSGLLDLHPEPPNSVSFPDPPGLAVLEGSDHGPTITRRVIVV